MEWVAASYGIQPAQTNMRRPCLKHASLRKNLANSRYWKPCYGLRKEASFFAKSILRACSTLPITSAFPFREKYWKDLSIKYLFDFVLPGGFASCSIELASYTWSPDHISQWKQIVL